MTDTDILIIRKMLGILNGIGPAGLEEQDLAVKLLRDRRWIASYRQPVTERVRWYITEHGKIAYAGL